VSAECVVHCTDFASRHYLSYILTALSSHADDTRQAAYHCLRLYYDHVDAALTQHHHAVPSMLLYLLDCVRYGVEETNQRLPCIITVFLARAAHLLTTPGMAFMPVCVMLCFGGLSAQISWFGLRVGGHPAARRSVCIHQMNRVNSRNDMSR